MPAVMKNDFMARIHGGPESGHFGVEKTVRAVQRHAYWPGWKRDVETHVRRCEQCCRYRRGPRFQGPLQEATSCGPMRKVHIDLTGPHPRSQQGFVYILTVICQFTKYLIAVPLRDKTALSVAKALVKHVYLVYGAGELEVSDQGKEFCNQIAENVARMMGVQKVHTTAWRPSANGVIERVHATMHAIFAKTVRENQRDWCERTPYVAYAYNTAYHSSVKHSPFYLMFGREPITGIDLMLDNPTELVPNDLDEYTEQMAERMNTAYKVVGEQLHCVFSRDKKRYDARVKECRFSVGDWVWFYCPRRKLNRNRKWQLFTSGPYLITARINSVNYAIQMGPRGRKFVVHIDRLRRYEGDISAANERWRQSVFNFAGYGENCEHAPNTRRTAPNKRRTKRRTVANKKSHAA